METAHVRLNPALYTQKTLGDPPPEAILGTRVDMNLAIQYVESLTIKYGGIFHLTDEVYNGHFWQYQGRDPQLYHLLVFMLEPGDLIWESKVIPNPRFALR